MSCASSRGSSALAVSNSDRPYSRRALRVGARNETRTVLVHLAEPISAWLDYVVARGDAESRGDAVRRIVIAVDWESATSPVESHGETYRTVTATVGVRLLDATIERSDAGVRAGRLGSRAGAIRRAVVAAYNEEHPGCRPGALKTPEGTRPNELYAA